MLSLSSIAGHRTLTSLLAHAIARDTLPPTLLFVGPAGVGKFRVARAVAACLNCLQPVRDAAGLAVDACQICRSCTRVDRGVHVDVFAIEPDDRASIKIDVIREVLASTGFKPFEGQRRVVLLRDADTLEPASQNALLKSLEEPPPGTVFILTTAVPGSLLPTVRSRCIRLRFSRLTVADVVRVLVDQHQFSEGDARDAAAFADGSVGQALALGSTDMGVLRETALLLLRQTASGLAVAPRLQAAAVVATEAPKKDRPRADVALVLQSLASMLRDIELLNSGVDRCALANPTLSDELRGLTRAFTGTRARDAFSAVDRAMMALERNAGTKVVSEWLALQI